MQMELVALFHRNFPFTVREEATVAEILSKNENIVFEKRNDLDEFIGAAVVHKDTLLLLCVDEAYRKQGIGSELLHDGKEDVVVKEQKRWEQKQDEKCLAFLCEQWYHKTNLAEAN